MNVFEYLTSSCLLGARCGSWVLFIVTLVNLCPRSLFSLFLQSLDFFIYNPAVCRQWWFCFLLFWPCVFGYLALYVDLGRSRLRETRCEQSGQPPSCLKGNRLCFCCDGADRGVPSLPGLLGVFRVNVRIAQWAGVFPAFCKLPHSSCTAQGTPRVLSCCHSNLTWCQLSVSVDFWHDSKHPRNQLRGLQVTEIAFNMW